MPYTLRELVWMARGKQDDLWWHTAALMSLQANAARDPKRKPSPYTPYDFHPTATKPKAVAQKLTPEATARIKRTFNKRG